MDVSHRCVHGGTHAAPVQIHADSGTEEAHEIMTVARDDVRYADRVLYGVEIAGEEHTTVSYHELRCAPALSKPRPERPINRKKSFMLPELPADLYGANSRGNSSVTYRRAVVKCSRIPMKTSPPPEDSR